MADSIESAVEAGDHPLVLRLMALSLARALDAQPDADLSVRLAANRELRQTLADLSAVSPPAPSEESQRLSTPVSQ